MKATDLMIGDWVYNKHHKKYICITPYDFFTHGHLPSGRQYFIGEPKVTSGRDLEPIPITREILEKNGFVYRKNSGAFVVYAEESYSNQTVEVTLFNVESEFRNIQLHICESNYPEETMLHLMECNYVHQLQHVFRSCGIKKEIIL